MSDNFRFFADYLANELHHPDFDTRCHRNQVSWAGRSGGADHSVERTAHAGQSPFIVFADTDMESAVANAVEQYDNAGQVCLAGVRLQVEESVHDEFVDRFVQRARALRQGDPRDVATDIGPQISREHFERIDDFVRGALDDGAQAVIGGGPNEELGGLYYQPTLFAGAAAGSQIMTQEVFGPVLTVQTFRDEDDAIRLANGTEFGLAAILFTGDPRRAERVAAQLIAGTTWVNCFFVSNLRAPFGGNRHSGVGREGGTWSFDFYCDVNNTCTNQQRWTR